MAGVLDDYLVDPNVSLLDKVRMQALRDWSKQLFAAIGDGIEGSPRRKFATIQRPWGEVSGKEVEFEILRHDEEAMEFDVTRCRFAEFFRALGEPDLGAMLICETDFDIASVGDGEVNLDRAQTIMRGAPSCTFRYKFAPR
jgi:hypothetical protein